SLSDPVELESLVRQAGFSKVTILVESVTFYFTGGIEHRLSSAMNSSITGQLRDVTEEQRKEFMTLGRRLLEPMVHDGVLHCPGRINIALAN
nr:hypothetical protein [Longispora sp. (in: high G+C Gram-positive bacteria)]